MVWSPGCDDLWLVVEAEVEEPEQPLPKRAKRKTQERFGLWCYTRKTKGDFAYKQHLQKMFDTAHPVSHVAHIDNKYIFDRIWHVY